VPLNPADSLAGLKLSRGFFLHPGQTLASARLLLAGALAGPEAIPHLDKADAGGADD